MYLSRVILFKRLAGPLAIQEDIANALENEAGSGSDSDSSDSSGSSSSSSFGQMCDESDTKGKKRAKSKAKSAPAKKAKVDESQKVSQKPLQGAKRKGAAEKDQARFEVVFSGHEKCAALLDEVTPASIWRSLVRSIEVERRLSKASTTVLDLQQLQSNSNLEDDQIIRSRNLEKCIAENVQWITAMKDAAKSVRTLEPLELSKELSGSNFSQLFAKCATQLFADATTLLDMLHTMAKKLFDATWLDV